MSSALEKLTFTVLLLDKLSGPSKSVCKSMRKLQSEGRDAMKTFGTGFAGVAAAAMSLHAFTGPARDFTRALGEVGSLSVAQDELEKLGAAGKKYAMRFGGNAAEIVRSGYDIQSAIPGLAKGALAEFTYQGALLAKAGKSNAGTITSYMGTMYNIFEKDARRIGDAKWVEQLTGKTAHAIKIFKTTGDDMSAAFTNLGATGQVSGVSLDEQMAVIGTLQSTMGGANAGTAYKAFLNKVGRAQQRLGMEFADSQGQMLPMVEILDKIRAEVGDGNLTTANATKLIQAFGEEGGKAVMNLLGKTDTLRGAMGELNAIQDSAVAAQMAGDQTDALHRFLGVLGVVRTTIGQTLLPAINAILSIMGGALRVLQWLLDKLPPLRWLIGGVVIAVSALTMAWSAFMMVSGAAKIIRVLYMEMRILWAWCLKNSAAMHSMTTAQRIGAVASMLWSRTIGGSAIWLKIATVAQWFLNAALYGCPLVWIVAAFLALVGVVVLVVKYWDQLCALVLRFADFLLYFLGPIGWAVIAFRHWDKIVEILKNVWGWFKTVCPNIANLIEKLVAVLWAGLKGTYDFYRSVFVGIYRFFVSVFSAIGNFFVGLWDGMMAPLRQFHDYLADKLVPLVQFFGKLFEWVMSLPGLAWEGIKSLLGSVDGLLGKLLSTMAKIPGLGFLDPDVNVAGAPVKPVVPDATAARHGTRDIPAGGIRNSSSTHNVNYGGVTINTAAPATPGMLEEMWMMNGGLA